jgi:transcriptional regulator of aromatic amino acid metabolism
MTVIQYEQDEITCIKKLISITEVNLTNSVRLLFGSLTRQQIEELDKIVKSVPGKQSPTPEQYEAMYSVRNSLQPLAAAIHLDIKCDSDQSRIQCSFNHFHDFLKNNPDRIIAHSTTGNFRGKKVIEELASPPRKKSKNYPEKCHWREIQKKEPLLVLTKAGLPKKNSKDNKEIVKRYPFTPLPTPDSAPHSPPP